MFTVRPLKQPWKYQRSTRSYLAKLQKNTQRKFSPLSAHSHADWFLTDPWRLLQDRQKAALHKNSRDTRESLCG